MSASGLPKTIVKSIGGVAMKKLKSQSLSGEVRDEILKFIKKSYDGQNTKLPTEEQFSEKLGVSRITIRTALNSLANEGFIFRRQGKGTFINPEAISMKVPFAAVHLFNDIIALGGYEPTVATLPSAITPAPAPVAEMLHVQPGEPLVMAPKVFYASNTPCAYIEDYFSLAILGHAGDYREIEGYSGSLFDYLDERCSRRIIWDRTEIKTVATADDEHVARQFKSNNTAKSLLLLDCVNFDQNDEPLLFAKEYIDTAYIQFNSIRYKKF